MAAVPEVRNFTKEIGAVTPKFGNREFPSGLTDNNSGEVKKPAPVPTL